METQTAFEAAFEKKGVLSPRKKLLKVVRAAIARAKGNFMDAVDVVRVRCRESADLCWALHRPQDHDAAIRGVIREVAPEFCQPREVDPPLPTRRDFSVIAEASATVARSILDEPTELGKPWRSCTRQELSALAGRYGHMAAFARLLLQPMPEIGTVGDYIDDTDAARLWQRAAMLSE